MERAIVDSGVVVTAGTKSERDGASGVAIYGQGAAPEADAETERVGR